MKPKRSTDRELLAKIERLPSKQRAEVEAFIDLLWNADEGRAHTFAIEQLSEAAFNRVWDNPEDAVYDTL